MIIYLVFLLRLFQAQVKSVILLSKASECNLCLFEVNACSDLVSLLDCDWDHLLLDVIILDVCWSVQSLSLLSKENSLLDI